jgi:hypothetical protein
MSNKITTGDTMARVDVVLVWKLGTTVKEYVVTLDRKHVLRTGGRSTADYGQARAFADGLIYGLQVAK